MKTRKLAVLVTVAAFMLASVAVNAGEFKKSGESPKTISVSLYQAVQMPALVIAMSQQLDQSMLTPSEGPITLNVSYQGYTVAISGTYQQWLFFFNVFNINSGSVKSIEVQTS